VSARNPEWRDKIVPISNSSTSPPPNAGQLLPVTQEFRALGEENTVDTENLVKGYKYGPDQYVVVEKDEIQKLTPETSTTMDLQHFVKLSEVDPTFFERSYYVAAETGGEKAYALLLQAMLRTGYCGVATVAMHRRQHVIILRPRQQMIVAHTMYYVDEIRDAPKLSLDTTEVSEKELRLAEAFIRALAGPFHPEDFRDEYRSSLESLIQGKVHAGEVSAPSLAPATTKPLDIMEALKKSLEQLQATKQPVRRVRPKPSTTPKARKPRSA
jgi:DNA end-binding protein Ku